MSTEIWRDVQGYEGLYQVSNMGNVRSLDRTVKQLSRCGNPTIHHYKGRILKPSYDKDGYVMAHFKVNGKHVNMKVHRLVASSFCDRPDGCDVVDHINANPRDNRAENLRWCTAKQNVHYAIESGHLDLVKNSEILQAHKVREKNRKAVSVKIICDDGRIFASEVEAAAALGCSQTNIYSAISGRIRTCKGHVLKRYEGE